MVGNLFVFDCMPQAYCIMYQAPTYFVVGTQKMQRHIFKNIIHIYSAQFNGFKVLLQSPTNLTMI
jgi:hypothetical protein